jgi:hypothetical protein
VTLIYLSIYLCDLIYNSIFTGSKIQSYNIDGIYKGRQKDVDNSNYNKNAINTLPRPLNINKRPNRKNGVPNLEPIEE